MEAGSGNDRLYGELQDDRMYGEEGDDLLVVHPRVVLARLHEQPGE